MKRGHRSVSLDHSDRMDNTAITMLLCALRRRRKKRKPRTVWIHPFISSRKTNGKFYCDYESLRRNPKKFRNCFRMNIDTFDQLLERLHNGLQRKDTNMRKCISPSEMLMVTLTYLAKGHSFTDLHESFKLGISTIAQIIRCTCKVIWNELSPECMPELTEQRLKQIATEYESKANFPHCIGAIDGKHIRMIKPNNSGSLFFNYKEFFSIVLFAVVDADYRFIYIDVGAFGKECDSTIFQKSTLYEHLQRNQIMLPNPEPLASTRNEDMPFVFVADEAFGLSPNIMRPYSGRNLPTPKRVFNYRLSRARRYVECAFGILSNKWRIFHRPLNVKTDLAIDIVKCCCVLHNFVRARDGCYPRDSMMIIDNEDVITDITQSQTTRRVTAANTIRDMFTEYFISEEGALPWQLSVI